MKKMNSVTIALRLVGLVKPLLLFMILAILFGITGHLFAILIPVFGTGALLELAEPGSFFALKTVLISLFVFALTRGILHYLEQDCNHYIAFKLLAIIRDRVFTALRKLAPAKLEGRDKGDLISLVTADVELLEVFYAHTISPVFIALTVSGVMCFMIGSFHWILGLLALIAYLTIGVFVPVFFARAGQEKANAFRGEFSSLNSFVLESLRGMKESIQYAFAEKRLNQMMEKSSALSELEEEVKENAAKNSGITNFLILFFTALMLYVSSVLSDGNLASVLLPTVLLMSSFGPVLALAGLGSSLQNTFAAGERVLALLDEAPQTEEITDGIDLVYSGLEAKQLDFSYEDEKILSDIDFRLEGNGILAVQGKSGSGKSTLLRLLMRFWDPDAGSITMNGENLKKVNTASLRNTQSFLTQDTVLFHDTIEENLRIAKPDASMEEIVDAAKKASIHDLIESLPQGYQTPVAELGDSLSGGEKQRIGLARAFLHGAEVMLFDEPTSNLDVLNEAIILKSIRQAKQDHRIILVSHRPSTQRISDETIYIESGRIS